MLAPAAFLLLALVGVRQPPVPDDTSAAHAERERLRDLGIVGKSRYLGPWQPGVMRFPLTETSPVETAPPFEVLEDPVRLVKGMPVRVRPVRDADGAEAWLVEAGRGRGVLMDRPSLARYVRRGAATPIPRKSRRSSRRMTLLRSKNRTIDKNPPISDTCPGVFVNCAVFATRYGRFGDDPARHGHRGTDRWERTMIGRSHVVRGEP